MNHVRNIARTALALALLTGTAALAQTATSTASSTVATSNTLSVTAGGTLDLSPSAAGSLATVSDSSTALSFATNDGVTYRITIAAAAWTFTPAVTGKIANKYPLLKFVTATSTAGTAVTTAATLVGGSSNTPAAAANVVTGLTSVSGTATVTISADYTQDVVAGAYSTTLTYTLAIP